MRTIPNHTPKFKDYPESRSGDAFVETLFDDFCLKLIIAERTNALADAIAAGHARARFIWHFEKLPGVSAEGSA